MITRVNRRSTAHRPAARLPPALQLLRTQVDRLHVDGASVAHCEARRLGDHLARAALHQVVNLRADRGVIGGRRVTERALGQIAVPKPFGQ